VKHRRLVATALLFGASFLAARPAGADPSDATRATARALAEEGHEALERKDFVTAADRFARADALVHAPKLLRDLARAQAGLGKLVAAQETYSKIIHEGAPPGSLPMTAEVVDTAYKERDALTPRLAWVTVTVTGAAGAKVTVDGEAMPSAALGVPNALDPGRHVVSAVALDGGRAEVTVTLAEGARQAVPLELEPLAVAKQPVPSAMSAAPAPSAALADVPAPIVKRSAQKTAGFVSLGVGAAGLLLGGATGVAAIVVRNETVGGCTDGRCPPSLASKVDSYNTLASRASIGFIAGGALAGLGVVLLATSPTAKGRVGLMVGPGALGAAGSF
jgi:hypothetical protein